MEHQIPWRVEIGLGSLAAPFPHVTLVSCPSYSFYLSRNQVDFFDCVAFCVGNIQQVSHQNHSLGMIEICGGKVPIGHARLSGANDSQHRSFQRSDNDSVVIGIGDV